MNLKEKLKVTRDLHSQVRKTSMIEPDSMIIATQTPESGPSVRVVLVKDINEKGIVFYTNLGSRKARDLCQNPDICLFFDWKAIGKRVKVKGIAEPIEESTADQYFASRERGSQIGAWASKQSQKLVGYELQKRIAWFSLKFLFKSVRRPKFWSGFIVRPSEIEIFDI